MQHHTETICDNWGDKEQSKNRQMYHREKEAINQQIVPKRLILKIFFPICNGILYVRRTGGDSRSTKEKNIKRFPHRPSQYSEDKSFYEKLCFLADYEQINRRTCKILQTLCYCRKDTNSEINLVAKYG